MEKISVIVPVYNAEKYLERCVDSILKQTYKNIELILVDDGSNDNSANICDKISAEDSRVVVIHQKNQGASAARNTGLQVCTGDYIGFVDSDDYICDTMYEKMLNQLNTTGNRIAMCDYYKISQKSKECVVTCEDDERSSSDFLKDIYLGKYMGVLWNKLFAKELFLNNGDPIRFDDDLHFCEDALLLTKLVGKQKVSIVHTPLYNYIELDNSLSHGKLNSRKLSLIHAMDRITDFAEQHYPELTVEAHTFAARSKLMIHQMCYSSPDNKKYAKDILCSAKKNLKKAQGFNRAKLCAYAWFPHMMYCYNEFKRKKCCK